MINNYQKGSIMLDKIARSNKRPSLLLHSCCGPCSTYPLELLNKYFDITIYFNNSNIYPEDEYNHRLKVQQQYIEIFNKENKAPVNIVVEPYDNNSYNNILKYRKDDKENGPRCKLCYVTRLKQAFEFAQKNHFDYCSTVMSMSRQKDEQAINRIGQVLEKQFDSVKFLVHNFKKKGGQERRDEIVDKYQLYDQKYCGCIYSLNEKSTKK